MYSVMWSEHCSYKSSRVHLKQFGEKAPKTAALLVGPGENAGVVDVGEGLAVTFKVESHNHPSYVEPYQGAATGVGGIVRDILTMGARPIARHGPAALRPGRRPGHRAGAARRGGRHRRLRQLPGRAEHRRRDRLRPLLPGQPAGQRAVRGRHAGRRDQAGQGPGPGQPGDPVRRPHRRRRHRRRLGAGQRHLRRGRPGQAALASRSATRSWRRCSSSAAWRSSRPTWSWASRTWARPGSPAPPPSWPRPAPAAWTCGWTWRRCATRR